FTRSSLAEKTGSAMTAIAPVAGGRVSSALRNHATVEAEGSVASSCSTVNGVMDERRLESRLGFVLGAIEGLRGAGSAANGIRCSPPSQTIQIFRFCSNGLTGASSLSLRN